MDQEYLDVAVHAARAAGQIALDHRGRDLQVTNKAHRADPVTAADRAAEQRIREIIRARFSDHCILGEEEGASGQDAAYRWVVDPIDGTLNYACGFPVYCTSIALEVAGEAHVGVIYDPERDELFGAVRGKGATLNGVRMEVTSTPLLADAFLGTGFNYRSDADEVRATMRLAAEVLSRARGLRRPGAAAIDLAYVAAGRYDGFWEAGLKPWDAAAGVLLIAESGGQVSNADGAAYALDDPMIVATNGRFHDELLAVLAGR